jgi:hypothetical protein
MIYIFFLGNGKIRISDLTIYLIGMRPVGKVFINIGVSGSFTLSECVIKISEVFYSWGSPGNSWNGTLINLNNGRFLFENTEFNIICVSRSNTLISSTIVSGKEFKITKCIFNECGCIDDGKVIYLNGPGSCLISESEFISCFCNNGGGIYVEGTIELNVKKSTFKDCVSSGNDGGGINIQFIYKIRNIYRYIDR